MHENGYITDEQTALAQSKALGVKRASGSDSANAPYFTEEVRKELAETYGTKALYEGGLSVRTTLDPQLQKLAERALREGLEALDRRQGWRGPLARLVPEESIDAQLKALTEKLPENRFAALVTKVDDKQAEIYLQGQTAVIPFALASWAYPPRRANGIRPPKISSLKQALTADDIVIVQHPNEAPDLVADTGFPSDVFALGQRPLVGELLLRSTRIPDVYSP